MRLNVGRKHKTVYPERVQYLDKSYSLSLLLKHRTLSHETHSFGKSLQTVAKRLHTYKINTDVTFNFF